LSLGRRDRFFHQDASPEGNHFEGEIERNFSLEEAHDMDSDSRSTSALASAPLMQKPRRHRGAIRQAEIARAVRAVIRAGLKVTAVRLDANGALIETTDRDAIRPTILQPRIQL
jgi:hypothetical protein